MGIVDWGHRPTPDVFLLRGLGTDGDWNASNYASSAFDGLVQDYRSAIDVESQRQAIGAIQQVLHTDVPALTPAFFDYVAAHQSSIGNIQATSLGHLQLHRATRV